MVDDKQKHQTIFSTPFDNARENYIAWSNQGTPAQLQDNKRNNIISEHNQKQERWEELGGPNYNIMGPGRPAFNMPQYPVLNEGKLGPGWMEAKNKTYGLPGTKVAQTWRINSGNYGEDDQASVDPDDWRTIIKILESGGDPDDYVTTVDFEEEQQPVEKEKGILNNPLRNELLRRMGKSRRKKDLDALRRMDWERIINRHTFNLIPGTGEENPIFGEPYWNI